MAAHLTSQLVRTTFRPLTSMTIGPEMSVFARVSMFAERQMSNVLPGAMERPVAPVDLIKRSLQGGANVTPGISSVGLIGAGLTGLFVG